MSELLKTVLTNEAARGDSVHEVIASKVSASADPWL